ncbi:hypothetical protein Tco_0856364 [Tanacetum coccineum]|uniref:Uncharacterized protein n=1 Tax=Tanacetum coccineum TaxID=301880 RepID=A0ABQ5B5V3_9ASTR
MDEANFTMEDYIELEAEKACRCGQTFNWETATYGKFMYHEDIDYFKEFETDLPVIIFNDAVMTDHKISSQPMKNLRTDSEDDTYEVNIPSNNVVVEQLDNGIDNTDTQSYEFDEDLKMNHDIHREPSNMEDYLILIEIWHHYHPELKDTSGSDISSRDTLTRSSKISRRGWALRLHTAEEMAGDGFDGYWADSLREIATKSDLSGYWSKIDFDGDFLEMVPSYTSIRDPLRRLCHRLIALSISGRG